MFSHKEESLKVWVCCSSQLPRLRSLWLSPDMCPLRATNFAIGHQWLGVLSLLATHPESLVSYTESILFDFPLVGVGWGTNLCSDASNWLWPAPGDSPYSKLPPHLRKHLLSICILVPKWQNFTNAIWRMPEKWVSSAALRSTWFRKNYSFQRYLRGNKIA